MGDVGSGGEALEGDGELSLDDLERVGGERVHVV